MKSQKVNTATGDYTLQIWWQPQKIVKQKLSSSSKNRRRLLATIKNFEQSPAFLSRKAHRLEIKSLADYFVYCQTNNLNQNKLMFEPEELRNAKVLTLINSKQEPLKVLTLRVNDGSRWVIALHGWGENKYLALHQAYLFAQLGFNVLTFDLRGHGESYGEETDFGFHSHRDLSTIITYLKRHQGMNHYGIVGLSIGASTALHYLQKQGYRDPQLKFVVSDCAFANLDQALRYYVQQKYDLPWWKVSLSVRDKFKRYFKFDSKRYDLLTPLGMQRSAPIPVLFVHGAKDTKIPVTHAKQLYAQKITFEKPSQSQLLIIPHADHKEAIIHGNKHYVKGVVNFLKRHGEV